VTAERPSPLFRSQIVPTFLARLTDAGADTRALIRKFDLPADADARRELDVPLSVAQALGDEAARTMDDPYFGLHVAQWLPRGGYGLLEFLLRSARNVRDAASRFVRYSGMLNDLVILELEVGEAEAVLTHRIVGWPVCLGRHANEFALALMVRVLRESIQAERWCPSRIAFGHAEPPDTGELLSYFGVETIAFDHGHNELAVRRADLELPLMSADSALLAVLDEQAMRLIAAKPDPGDAFWSRLRELVRVSLRDGPLRLEMVAHDLETSPRTLQRRLEAKGTSFNALVDDIRRDLARMYVEAGTLADVEVAFLLGYADRRAFVRAYKRWTGATPAAHRQR
jgi:AraC-like DNA-binding protein